MCRVHGHRIYLLVKIHSDDNFMHSRNEKFMLFRLVYITKIQINSYIIQPALCRDPIQSELRGVHF